MVHAAHTAVLASRPLRALASILAPSAHRSRLQGQHCSDEPFGWVSQARVGDHCGKRLEQLTFRSAPHHALFAPLVRTSLVAFKTPAWLFVMKDWTHEST